MFCTHLYLHVHRHRPWCSTLHPTWTQLRRSTLWSSLPVPGTLQHGPEWLEIKPCIPKDTSVQHVGIIDRQLTSFWIQRKFTSLMKSSCFLSSASIARSSMPPGVALSVWQNNSSDLVTVIVSHCPTTYSYYLLAVHFKKMSLCS